MSTAARHGRTTEMRLVALSLSLVALFAMIPPACSKGQAMPKTFVLVHGAWMGGFAWQEVKADLERRGETVITLDLPGHGDDQTPPEGQTLAAYTQAVVRAIGARTDVTLVGHSFGGIVISAVAEAIPERLSKLVYVAAYLPRSGESVFSLSQEDKDSKVGQFWTQTDAQGPVTIRADGIPLVFCADCSDAQKQLLVARHRPEALAPLGTPVNLSERYASVKRYYVETLQDNAVSHALQTLMVGRTTVAGRVQLNTSHSPFLSQPKALADALERF
jgi:pimeloyl-ACP methyl ester carboxylesterase